MSEQRATQPTPATPADAKSARPASFDQLVAQNMGLLEATARSLTRSDSDARDLVQDTIEKALRSFASFRPGSDGRAWLLSILHHRFIDSCRQAANRAIRVDADKVADVIAMPPAEDRPAWENVSLAQVRQALGNIGDEFRLIFELYEFEGVSYRQIAEKLGIPPATVGTRLCRARRKLKEALMEMLQPRENE
jgi:RNA polymerase sigma-70 factor (ECF subfamily)